jgi:phenylpropionate dioxygenase-like ring-hydroxylating dioxygenase large terminal subunit
MTFLRNCCQVAAYGREVIAGRIMTRRIANEPLILLRTARGKLVAMEDRCPHRSAPLSNGTLLGEQIRCGYHGLRFDVEGRVINLMTPETESTSRYFWAFARNFGTRCRGVRNERHSIDR